MYYIHTRIFFPDFNQDGKPDNISFMIKRVKVHSNPDPSYKFLGNYGVEKFLEIFSGKSESTKNAARARICILIRVTRARFWHFGNFAFGTERTRDIYIYINKKTIPPLDRYFYTLKGQHKRPFYAAGAVFYAFILRLN